MMMLSFPLLLTTAETLTALATNAQCDADYDFGEAGFGVSPDPTMGETFATGYLGDAYEDIIHMLVPSEAGDIDSAYIGMGAVIDSLRLESVSLLMNDMVVDLSNIGLNVVCVNNGDSPDECTYLGGQQYCSVIEGTPNTAGEFPLTINVTAYLTVFGSAQGIPYEFTDYTLLVEAESAVAEAAGLELEVQQNTPNPFSGYTTINYTVGQSSEVKFEVMNLLGETAMNETYKANTGANQIKVSGNQLNAGIYLYSLQVGDKKITYRMVVND